MMMSYETPVYYGSLATRQQPHISNALHVSLFQSAVEFWVLTGQEVLIISSDDSAAENGQLWKCCVYFRLNVVQQQLES